VADTGRLVLVGCGAGRIELHQAIHCSYWATGAGPSHPSTRFRLQRRATCPRKAELGAKQKQPKLHRRLFCCQLERPGTRPEAASPRQPDRPFNCTSSLPHHQQPTISLPLLYYCVFPALLIFHRESSFRQGLLLDFSTASLGISDLGLIACFPVQPSRPNTACALYVLQSSTPNIFSTSNAPQQPRPRVYLVAPTTRTHLSDCQLLSSRHGEAFQSP
jgi:hypothetical protein